MKKHLLVPIMLCVGLLGCKKEPDAQVELSISSESSFVTINANKISGSVVFPMEGGRAEIAVATNQTTFDIDDSDVSWLSVEPSSDKITLTCTENPTDDEQTGTITITAGTGKGAKTATLNVRQLFEAAQEITLSLEPDNVTFEAEGGTLYVDVITNSDSYTISQPTNGWVSATKDGKTIVLNADPNEEGQALTSSIIVSAGEGEGIKTTTLSISQKYTDPNAFIFVLDIPAANTLAIAPIYGEVKASVNWGDGSASDSYDANFIAQEMSAIHTYAKPGKYEVVVSGEVSHLYATAMGQTRDYLVEVKQWGRLGFIWLENAFAGCRNLTTIPGDTKGSFSNVVTFWRAFSYTGLKSIPANLFEYATECENFRNVFDSDEFGTGNLTSIPEGLFDNCTKALAFSGLFAGQNRITSIPENLFRNNVLAYEFNKTFMYMGISSIPENLFANNNGARYFNYIFQGNANLTNVPEDLFKNNWEIDSLSYAFANCTNLRSVPAGLFKYNTHVITFYGAFMKSGIETVPAGLFDANIEVRNLSALFMGCPNLKTVPSELFAKTTKVVEISNIFNASGIETVPSSLFDAPELLYATGLFYDCGNLKTIPSDLFAKMPKLELIDRVFRQCYALETVPSKLFANLTAVKTAKEIFYDCTSLNTIPADLFEGTTKIANLESTFRNCAIVSIPEGIFDPITELSNITGLFAGNSRLKSVPVSLFDNNKKLYNAPIVFEGCSSWEGESPYTMVNSQKVHLYERSTDNGFRAFMVNTRCFSGCTKLTDYASIPATWK